MVADVQHAQRLGDRTVRVQRLRHPHAAGVDADEDRQTDSAGGQKGFNRIAKMGEYGTDVNPLVR